MTVLAFDTTSHPASIAVRQAGVVASQITLESTSGFAHLLYPALEKCLTESQVKLEGITCFAAAAGPGSFTGVRVGLAAAKALAESMGKPAIGVSNLLALSSFRTDDSRLAAVALDARRGEFYTAVYGANGQPVQPEAVVSFEIWLRSLDPALPCEFLSGTPLPLAGTPFASMPFTLANAPLAAAIAALAEAQLAAGKPGDPAALDANYVRRSDAELFWRA